MPLLFRFMAERESARIRTSIMGDRMCFRLFCPSAEFGGMLPLLQIWIADLDRQSAPWILLPVPQLAGHAIAFRPMSRHGIRWR